jgi:hypothetical protein
MAAGISTHWVRIIKSDGCLPCKDLAKDLSTVNDKFIQWVDIHDVDYEVRGVPHITLLEGYSEIEHMVGYSKYNAQIIIDWIYK